MKNLFIVIAALILLTGCFINNSSDNKIYKVGRVFDYTVTYYDSLGGIVKQEPLNLNVTGGFYIGITQTKVVWLLRDSTGTEFESQTGAIDNEKKIWIHPPRIGDLEFTSYAEFPGINPSLEKNIPATSDGKISFPANRKFRNVPVTEVKTVSEVIKEPKDITVPAGTFKDCRVIKTKGISELGTIYGDYYFHPVYGFVYWEYNTPWKTKVTMELTKANF